MHTTNVRKPRTPAPTAARREAAPQRRPHESTRAGPERLPGSAVTVARVALTDLQTDPLNVNRGTARGKEALATSLRELGAGRSILLDKHHVAIAGNKTLAEAAALGFEELLVVRPADPRKQLVAVERADLDVNEPAGRKMALADNRVSELDYELNAEGLETVREAFPEVTAGLWTPAELQALEADPNLVDAEPRFAEAETLRKKWRVRRGQLWELGAQRLFCGDCTMAEAYRRLFGNEHYALLVTDPPYGVSYADKNAFLNTVGRGNRIQEPIANDHHAPETMSQFWTTAFTCARTLAAPGASYYVTGPQGGELLLRLLLALRDSGFPLHHMLIWAKNNHVLGRCDYHYQHEPVLYGWVEGAGHHFYGGHGETSLWLINKPQAAEWHPTTKPIELYARAFRNSSQAGDVVADIFAGSGTALLAAEQLERHCRAMEIEPQYVAVALERFQEATGTTPRGIADGL